MFQKGSYDFENQLAGFIASEPATADKNNELNANQVSDEILDARSELQRLATRRHLNHRH